MRFLLIDKIEEIVKNSHARGSKTITFDESFSGAPCSESGTIPRTLILESAAQLASWLIMYSFDFTKMPLLAKMEEVSISKSARCGSRLIIDVEILSLNMDGALINSRVVVKNELIAYGKNCLCTLIDLENIASIVEMKIQFDNLRFGVGGQG